MAVPSVVLADRNISGYALPPVRRFCASKAIDGAIRAGWKRHSALSNLTGRRDRVEATKRGDDVAIDPPDADYSYSDGFSSDRAAVTVL